MVTSYDTGAGLSDDENVFFLLVLSFGTCAVLE